MKRKTNNIGCFTPSGTKNQSNSPSKNEGLEILGKKYNLGEKFTSVIMFTPYKLSETFMEQKHLYRHEYFIIYSIPNQANLLNIICLKIGSSL